jgi:hypothetical protein
MYADLIALRRHGRALLLGHRLVPCPPDGHSTIDRALRAEVNAVDDLGNAALAGAPAWFQRNSIGTRTVPLPSSNTQRGISPS